MSDRFAYYDREADIAWLPTGESSSVVSEQVAWGLIDHDSATDEVVAIEIQSASERLPAGVLAALPTPASGRDADEIEQRLAAIEHARGSVAHFAPGRNLADELIADRRTEESTRDEGREAH